MKKNDQKEIADWSIWDLHLHTSKSHDYEIKNAKIEDIIDSLLLKMDIKLIVITDHMIFDNKQYLEGNEHIKKRNYDLMLLPGCEIKIEIRNGTEHVDFLIATNPINSLKLENILKEIVKEKKQEKENIILSINELTNYFQEIEYVLYPEFNKSCGIMKKIKPDDKKSWDIINKLVLMRNISIVHGNSRKLNESREKLNQFCNNNDVEKIIAAVSSSDNHNYKVFPYARLKIKESEREKHLYIPTYFKALNTFEGLKMVASEVSRIEYENENQLIYKESKIKKMEFKNGNEVENKITFSPNLNVIIGSRSNGKSLILSIINEKFGNPAKLEKDLLNKYSKILKDLQISVYTFEDKLAELINKDKIDFYPQNFFINHFEKANNQNFEDLISILNIQLNEIDFTNIKLSMENFKNKFILEINLLNEFLNTINKLTNMNSLFKNFYEIIKNKELKNIWIKNNSNNLKFIEKIKADIKEYKELINIKENKFSEVKNKLIDLKNNMEFLFKNDIEFINENINKLMSFLDSKINNISNIKNGILKMEKNIVNNAYDKIKKNKYIINELYSSKEFNKNNFYTLGEITRQIDNIEIKNKSLLNKENWNDFSSIKESETLLSEKVKILKYAKFSISDKMKKFLENNFYKDFLSIKDLEEMTSSIIDKKNFLILKDKDFKIQLNNMFQIEEGYDFIYSGDKMNEVSPGKKAEILVEILLSDERLKNKSTILIDQPEDSLDNVYISDALVNKIRDLKLKKQLIIVTHNANLVINADAENVIFADKKSNNKFSYFNGAIEYATEYDGFSIIQIIEKYLEGGKRALAKRLNTYNSMLDSNINYEDITN